VKKVSSVAGIVTFTRNVSKTQDELRQALRSVLPHLYVATTTFQLEAPPFNPNGKIACKVLVRTLDENVLT